MPEKRSDKTIFSLAEVARSIHRTLAERYKQAYWIKAEMNKLNHYTHSGHCYPDLVEKKEGKVIAEMRSILWNSDYQRINRQFLEVAKEPLKNGITILFLATISYDPLHGLSLRILDIDPAYSLGQLEREKRESIDRLKQENLFDANKRLPFPTVPKRLAIISVETSKGYADFLKILNGNPWRYRFEQTLFPALLQGDRSVASIIDQLANIAKRADAYDVVAIIRGGGGDVGLSSYNQYPLAATIARFPIPVITGIGHSTNETVSEMVAYQNAITPSELADFLIQRFHRFSEPIARAQETILRKATQLLDAHHRKLNDLMRYFRLHGLHLLNQQHRGLEHHSVRLKMGSNNLLRQADHTLLHVKQTLKTVGTGTLRNRQGELAALENSVRLLDPQQVLNRGYSITRVNGQAIKSAAHLKDGDILKTVLASGNVTSTVNKTEHE